MNFPEDTDFISKQIIVRSATNPILWSCVTISLPLFYLSTQNEGWLSVALFIIATFPVGAFIFSYVFLLRTNPNYLRSEEYQLKAEALKYFGDKDNTFNVEARDVVEIVTNPKTATVPNPQPEDDKQLKVLSDSNK